MGTAPKLLGLYDPKQVELVKKITQKTRDDKIYWNKTPTGFISSIDNRMDLSFVRSPLIGLLTGSYWQLFAIRGQKGNEILKVENRTLNPFEVLAGLKDPLREAVSDLFQVVQEKAKGNVERAIDVIDNV